MWRFTTLTAVAAVALVVVACAPDSGATEAPATAGNGGAGQTVDVSLTEFEIDMPTSISAGEVTFNVTNDGTMEHAFEVEGNGIEDETDVLAAGDSATLTVNLEPGTYEVYCPVGNHRDMGMLLELEVTES